LKGGGALIWDQMSKFCPPPQFCLETQPEPLQNTMFSELCTINE